MLSDGDIGVGGAQAGSKTTHILYFAGRPLAQWMESPGEDAKLLLLTTDHLGVPILATDLAKGSAWHRPAGCRSSSAAAAI